MLSANNPSTINLLTTRLHDREDWPESFDMVHLNGKKLLEKLECVSDDQPLWYDTASSLDSIEWVQAKMLKMLGHKHFLLLRSILKF